MSREKRITKRKQRGISLEESRAKRFKSGSDNWPESKTEKESKSRKPATPNLFKNHHKRKNVSKKCDMAESFDLTDLDIGLDEVQKYLQPDSKEKIQMPCFLNQPNFDIQRDKYEEITEKIKESKGKEEETIKAEIKEILKGVKFNVRDVKNESCFHDVSNEVYIASVLLTFAIADAIDDQENMDLVRNFLDLGADPRVENLRSGASAIGIALLKEDFAQTFLQIITDKMYKFKKEKVNMAKSSVSNHLCLTWDYGNEDKIMSFIEMLYDDTEDTEI